MPRPLQMHVVSTYSGSHYKKHFSLLLRQRKKKGPGFLLGESARRDKWRFITCPLASQQAEFLQLAEEEEEASPPPALARGAAAACLTTANKNVKHTPEEHKRYSTMYIVQDEFQHVNGLEL